MLQIGPYSAWITVDGAALGTYDSSRVHGPSFQQATGWIASEAGKSFSVYWRNTLRDVAVGAVLKIDGVECSRHAMLSAHDDANPSDTIMIRSKQMPDGTQRNFVFFMFPGNNIPPGRWGTISLDLWRLRITRVFHQHSVFAYSMPLAQTWTMGGRHFVGLGQMYHVTQRTTYTADADRMDQIPFVSFRFRYGPQGSTGPLPSIQLRPYRNVERVRMVRPLPLIQSRPYPDVEGGSRSRPSPSRRARRARPYPEVERRANRNTTNSSRSRNPERPASLP
ncbi:hypothetical protein GYMLUDRAFT_667739 [Collybiopsis luxurians FD-317 M1]|uniref:Uncharacterized protein n=1 Tax=Collybiopsis luxurians FD-317 M1 TaxID=944289 RepID=A0A0D0B7H3_9AGAR|nr:hypothetical protein GYMLUDRAFT_667739 [Collybiopsis luxurians FD-317 M1]